MYISVNSQNEIKEVGISTDTSLTSLYVDEKNENFPFKGWSEVKICCYKVEVKDGIVTMLTPYIDSRLIDNFDQLGKASETNANDISDNREGIMETFESTMNNEMELEDCRTAIMELYEMKEV